MVDRKEYEVVLIPQPEGGFTVTVPELPDITTEGETREEALEMARDAIEGYLETARELGYPTNRAQRERVTVASA